MGLYEIKMLIKKLPVIGTAIRRYKEKQESQENAKKVAALKRNGASLVRHIEETLDGSGYEYFVDFGSLLGLVRDHKFIEYDNDVDYGVVMDEGFSWGEFEQRLTASGMKKVKQFKQGEKITEQTYAYNGLTVDFFGSYLQDGHLVTYVYFRKEGFIYHSANEFHAARLALYPIKGTKKLLINGLECSVPSEPEKYLASIYTENWRVPDPNWVSENGPSWQELKDVVATVQYF